MLEYLDRSEWLNAVLSTCSPPLGVKLCPSNLARSRLLNPLGSRINVDETTKIRLVIRLVLNLTSIRKDIEA